MVGKYLVGVDIGGTWIRVAISTLDLKREEIQIEREKTQKNNKFSISTQICGLLNILMKKNGIKKDQILGIGVASAGPLDLKEGIVFNSPNLGFKEIPLKEPISKNFPNIPFYLLNDCNAAVLGVHFFEASKIEKDNLVYITMSTGIGGGVICNGCLLLGKDGNAAEIGHSKVAPKSNKKCGCGAYGCWEAFSSGTGVRNRTLEAIEKGELKGDILSKIVNNKKSEIGAKEVFEAARKGDKLAQKIVNDCVFYTEVGVGLINNYYDCKSIFFGGGMMNDKKMILDPLKTQLKQNPLKFTINNPPEIRLTQFRDMIGILGALALVKYKEENHPVVSTYKF
ncbi:MAG: ROK family protein [Promethearchaeota archaeon]|nr:MAG: ROK family protein [Candidatus Lokiarchaeota archaeon]